MSETVSLKITTPGGEDIELDRHVFGHGRKEEKELLRIAAAVNAGQAVASVSKTTEEVEELDVPEWTPPPPPAPPKPPVRAAAPPPASPVGRTESGPADV